ncbi:polymorphic toxin-type HINT domain-containing protein [Acetivibrio saccincola]
MIDGNGKSIRIEYNAAGQQSALIDKTGNRTEYEYDAFGNLILVRYADGTTEKSTYDAEGRETSSTDRLGRTTRYEYDKLGRLIKTINPDGSCVENEYDPLGRIISVKDERGNVTKYKYDEVGNTTEVIDALGNVTKYEYDKNGNRTKMIDANGNVITFEYDSDNNPVRTIFPDGTYTSYEYNSIGQKISERDQAGLITVYEYDAAGRVTKVIDPLGNETCFEYDAKGNRISQTDANGNKVRFEYDKIGNVTKQILPLGYEEVITYDGEGRVTSKTDFNGNKIEFEYDVDGNLIKKTYPDGKSEVYTYTLSGQRESVTDERGTTYYEYDLMDRLIKQINPDGTQITYTYDKAGNCTSVTVPSGTTYYTYDELNRLKSVTDPDGNTTTYTYDAIGNRKSVTYPNKTTTEYEYDYLSRLISLLNRNEAGEIISSYKYTLGPAGNRIRTEENNGRVIKYTYDDTYKLIKEEIENPDGDKTIIEYTYDAVGNRLSKSVNGVVTEYTYDENNRLITEGQTVYTYDKNGNTLSKKTKTGEEVTYTYDYNNRLTKVNITGAKDASTVEYAYNVDGIRVQKVVDGIEVTNYLVDENRLYAQVLEERDGEGNLTVSYIYGDDLISQKRGDSFSYYHYDGIGSTRALTDIHGNITDTYTYDSFGMLTSRTGTTENDYLFTGEQYDANVNFYYLRARYMNPALGRFLTMDSWGGIITDPITLHKYLYADCDPVNKIDPSGHFSILGTLALVTYTVSIAAIALPVFAGIYLTIVNKVSVLDYISALCSEDVWIEAAIGIGMGAVLGLGIKAIAKKLACEVVAFIGVIMSLWSLYQSIDLSINMIKGGVSREQVARYLAVLTATVILTTIIGKVCFTEDTLIKTEDGYKEIKDIEVGDLVYSEDPLTGEKGLKRVTNIFVNETSVIVRIYAGDEEIETTPTHPFWVIGKGWVAAGDIEAGDKVYLYSGEGREVKEVRFEYLDTPIKVYNFEVEDWHTYFVSELDVFVHNSCKGKSNSNGSSQADVLANNRAQGRAFEQQEFAKFSSNNTNAVEQITIKTSNGTKIRVDAIGLDANGNIVINEFKSSTTAPLTQNQKIGFPELFSGGGTVVGKEKGMFTGGYQISPGIEVIIVRP